MDDNLEWFDDQDYLDWGDWGKFGEFILDDGRTLEGKISVVDVYTGHGDEIPVFEVGGLELPWHRVVKWRYTLKTDKEIKNL